MTNVAVINEICDPVEDDRYGYKIGGVLVTDFVTPNWFAHEHAQSTIDFQRHAKDPFAVLSGGYAQKFDPQKGWEQVNGSTAMMHARTRNPAVGSRRERRIRQWQRAPIPSTVDWTTRGTHTGG